MNPLVAILVAVGVNLAVAIVGTLAPRSEARVATLTGAAVTLGAAVLAALQLIVHDEPTEWAWRGIALRADALTGTMLLPLSLAGAGIALGLPWRRASSRVLAATSIVLAAGAFGLIANNLVLLLVAEVGAAIAVGWALGSWGRAGRVYLGIASALTAVAAALVIARGESHATLSSAPVAPSIALWVLAGSLVRLGVFPSQSGLTATLGGAPFGRAVLLAAPLSGVLPLIRIVHPALAPLPIGDSVELVVLSGALVAAFTAVASHDLGRSLGWMIVAMHGLLVAGLMDPSPTGVVGGELMWAGVLLSEVGLVLGAVMVTRRVGSLDMRRMHGLYAVAPWLSLGFLLNSLGLAGLPGTLVFVANDVLLNSESTLGLISPAIAAVLLALVGFNALRMSFQVFFGPSDFGPVDMDAKPIERFVLLGLVIVLLAGGLAPSLLPVVMHVGH